MDKKCFQNEQLNSSAISITKNIVIEMLKYSIGSSDNLIKDEIRTPEILFKKINFTFMGLSNLIKIRLLQINEENYQKANDQKILFPNDLNTLIIILATFDKAFNHDHKQFLFNLVSFHGFDILYKISKINPELHPFIIDEKTDYTKISNDFDEFNLIVTEFACDILNVNTDFETHNIVELSTEPVELSTEPVELSTEPVELSKELSSEPVEFSQDFINNLIKNKCINNTPNSINIEELMKNKINEEINSNPINIKELIKNKINNIKHKMQTDTLNKII
jgi:hypothetical protein